MIVKITRGGRTQGLMAYLVGPGRANEHTSPHLVAGSAGVMAWYSHDELNRADALSVGNFVDAPRRVTGTEVTVPVKTYDLDAGVKAATGERRPAHVWHCSLSLAPDHPPLDDSVWEQLATEFVEAMGYSDTGSDKGGPGLEESPCRWVAVHHGASVNGGDHIHLAVNLVREDGTKASTHNDYKRASTAVAALEKRHGLEVVAGRHVGRSARPENRAEVHRAQAAGATETYTARLSRTVRAAAAVSNDEGGFVRRCRDQALWVRPRFRTGGQDVVTGYAVAEAPPHGTRAVWKPGGALGRDLTLPRLRQSWVDTPEAAAAAAAEWRAAWRGQPVTTTRGPDDSYADRDPTFDPAVWERYTRETEQLRERLRSVDPDDHSTWARVAHETAGVFAAWSQRVETEPGPLAAAADELAKAAALHARQMRPARVAGLNLRGPAYLMMMLATDPRSKTGQALLLRQLMNTLRAIHDAQVATGQARQATRMSDMVRGRLLQVVGDLPGVDELSKRLDHAGGRGQPAEDRPVPPPPIPGMIARPDTAASRAAGRQARERPGFER